MTNLFINLLVNAAFSLAAGFLVVSFFLWLFRIGTGPAKLFLLSLPFAKVVYDCARGIPANSISLTNIDTFSLPPKHHILTLGSDFTKWGPALSLKFSSTNLDGKQYAESIGDYLAQGLNRSLGPTLPTIALGLVLLISAALLSRRLILGIRFERERRADQILSPSLRKVTLWPRTVEIYVSHHFTGSPFTGGIFKPYICIPAEARAKLDAEELEAVIAHELGHVRQFDILVTIAIQALGDFFWFIPCYRLLSRKIDRLRELVADQWAVRSGAEPALLASALTKLREIPAPKGFTLYSAFLREKSLLKLRVQRLLGDAPEKSPRFGWQNKWIRLAATVWIFTAVMTATFGGNHSVQNVKNPEWFDQILQKFGLANT